jgi:hypothetical protein
MNESSLPVERHFMTALSTAARRMRTAYDGIVGKRGLTLSRVLKVVIGNLETPA